MAGDINILKKRDRIRQKEARAMLDQVVSDFEAKQFFEYYLYPLKRKTDVLNNQVKQIQLFPEIKSKIKKIYRVESSRADRVSVIVSVKNSKENNLGFALPAGRIRIYKSDKTDLEFIGENNIKHTAKDEKLDIEVGAAFDIVSERKVISTDRKIKRSRRQNIEYHLRNHKDSDVQIEIIERVSPYYEIELHSSSERISEKEAGFMKFLITVPSNQEKILSIDYSTSW
jgi:hypothetical protein